MLFLHQGPRLVDRFYRQLFHHTQHLPCLLSRHRRLLFPAQSSKREPIPIALNPRPTPRVRNAQEFVTFPYERSHRLRPFRRNRHAPYLCSGEKESLVYSRLRRLLRARFDLRISARRMALRHRRSHLVDGGRPPLVAGEKWLADAFGGRHCTVTFTYVV